MNKDEYQEYRNSSHWIGLRYEKYKSVGFKCEECSATENLNCHHLTYERLGRELLSDLRILCQKCHYDVHFPPRTWKDIDDWLKNG